MPHIAAKVFDLVDRIAAAATPADAWCDYMTAARYVGLAHGTAFIDAADDQLASRSYIDDMPQGWMAEYAARHCRRIDPVADRIAHAITPFDFRIADWRADEARRPWYDLDRDAGIEEGLIVPFRADGALRAVALCGRAFVLDPHDRKALEFAGLEVLLRLRALAATSLSGPHGPQLSQRERECLQWVAVGKSDWEIGEILGLSEKTVNVYVERAKHKLQATTRAQAIVFALRRGAITP